VTNQAPRGRLPIVGNQADDVQSAQPSRNAPVLVADIVTDALYVGVGLAILGIQRTNVARRAFRADVERALGTPLTLPAVAAFAADAWDQTLGARRAGDRA
jgi:hypothetical protein